MTLHLHLAALLAMFRNHVLPETGVTVNTERSVPRTQLRHGMQMLQEMLPSEIGSVLNLIDQGQSQVKETLSTVQNLVEHSAPNGPSSDDVFLGPNPMRGYLLMIGEAFTTIDQATLHLIHPSHYVQGKYLLQTANNTGQHKLSLRLGTVQYHTYAPWISADILHRDYPHAAEAFRQLLEKDARTFDTSDYHESVGKLSRAFAPALPEEDLYLRVKLHDDSITLDFHRKQGTAPVAVPLSEKKQHLIRKIQSGIDVSDLLMTFLGLGMPLMPDPAPPIIIKLRLNTRT